MQASFSGRTSVPSALAGSARRVAPFRGPSAATAPSLQRRRLAGRPRLGLCAAVWDGSGTLTELRAQLEEALKVEDYTLAARLRDAIQQRSVDVKLQVEDANARFYSAFRSGNIKEMEAVWGEGDHVQCIHPGSEAIVTREAVLESWRSVLAGVRPRAFRIDVDDVRVWAGEGMGYVTCVEVVDADDSLGRVVATNVFEKQDGRWMMVLHQGGGVPARRRVRTGLTGL